MPTLILLRHAKAVSQSRGDDFARDLQPRGKAEAEALGVYLGTRDIVPDLALVSSSARTRQTFEIVAAALPRPVAVRYEDGLYNATAGDLRGVLNGIDRAVRMLLIVGHNPGIADAAAMLARDGDATELSRMRGRFPPCAAALLEIEAEDWREAAVRGGRLDLFLAPDDLTA